MLGKERVNRLRGAGIVSLLLLQSESEIKSMVLLAAWGRAWFQLGFPSILACRRPLLRGSMILELILCCCMLAVLAGEPGLGWGCAYAAAAAVPGEGKAARRPDSSLLLSEVGCKKVRNRLFSSSVVKGQGKIV